MRFRHAIYSFKKYDGPEFVATRQFFDRYFEKPMPTITFHDLVNRGRIVRWSALRGAILAQRVTSSDEVA